LFLAEIDHWKQGNFMSRNFAELLQTEMLKERVGGQPPKSLRQFLAEQAHLFSVGGPATIRG